MNLPMRLHGLPTRHTGPAIGESGASGRTAGSSLLAIAFPSGVACVVIMWSCR
jgi:hypothetical protein